MATEQTYTRSREAGTPSARPSYAQIVPVTMAAGATTQATITVPIGSALGAIRAEVATAFTGSPTNINLTVGTAAAGAQVVAATDVKAQGHIACTIVSTFDSVAGTDVYYLQIAAVGGTNPAGTVNVVLTYHPPGI